MVKNDVSKKLLAKIQEANLTPEQWKEFAETLVEEFDHRIGSLKTSETEFEQADNHEAAQRTFGRHDELLRTMSIAFQFFPQQS